RPRIPRTRSPSRLLPVEARGWRPAAPVSAAGLEPGRLREGRHVRPGSYGRRRWSARVAVWQRGPDAGEAGLARPSVEDGSEATSNRLFARCAGRTPPRTVA